MSSLQQERLPLELYYEFIIPHLLGEYIHQYIVYDKKQAWNPFTILPLVCKHFHELCRSFVRTRIFDVSREQTDADATQKIRTVLKSAWTLWRNAGILPLFERPRNLTIPSVYKNLMSSQSLIQIYMCAGYAKYYYTIDVLNALSLDRLWITDWIEGGNISPVHDAPGIGIPGSFQFRPYKMLDDRLHRVFLPFTCAMLLCDSVKHDALAETMADYLAKKAVTYGTEPILLKHVQDLEMNMARRYRLPLTMWSKWTKDTLRLINERHIFLKSVQKTGKLVSKYIRPSELSKQTIESTRVLDVLKVVSLVDWGNDTEDIRREAEMVLTNLNSGDAEPEENDEYFIVEDKKILFSKILRIPISRS